MTDTQDSQQYREKKKFFNQLLTIYGRKPVLEALSQPGINVHRLHLADSNKAAPIISDIIAIAERLGAEICYHNKAALSRISRNGKQDQGVAVDLHMQGYKGFDDFLAEAPKQFELLALDGITNPQNLGMILRSVAASGIAGVILPRNGCAQIDPLVIKASAGAVFRCPILRCDDLSEALAQLRDQGARICGLSSHAQTNLGELETSNTRVFVLGNETHGVSKPVQTLCNEWVSVAMHNGVESLNVAITASLIAFRQQLAATR